MANKRKAPKQRPARPGSLLSQEATGGIVAGAGLDFQARYATCHVPLWLSRDLISCSLRARATLTFDSAA